MQTSDDEPSDREAPAARRRVLPSPGRLIPLAVLVVGLIAYFAFDLGRYVSLESLKLHRGILMSWVEGYGVGAGIAFAAVYAVAVAFSIPGAVILTVIGGFLFGPYAATVYVVFGATIGATALFLAARYAFCDFLRARAGNAIRRMETGFNENPFSYMLILRLVPLFPFWLVNLVPAFFGVSTRVFVISTFFGIMPGSFIFALVGDGAGAVLDAGKELNYLVIFEFRFIAPIIGLIFLATLPVIYKWLRRNRAGS